MTRVHCHYTQKQFWRHLKPIWDALPSTVRGDRITDLRPRIPRLYPSDDIFLVGGYGNIAACGPKRVIYVEHGAGQTYQRMRPNISPHYAGGKHPDNVVGYICPNAHVARLWNKPSAVVGCPALDDLSVNGDAAVITFHWDAPRVAPEARSARPHYIDHLHQIVQWARDADLKVIGHWHPRDKRAPIIWKNLRVDTEPDVDKALERARIVIADNTSVLYEAAQLGIPTVVLNAPWYRREVEHGLRFWEAVPGPMVEGPGQLLSQPIDDFLFASAAARELGAERAYGVPLRGGGAKIGAEFVMSFVD